VLARQSTSDVEIAVFVDRDGLRDLAVRAIELHLCASPGYVEDDVFTVIC